LWSMLNRFRLVAISSIDMNRLSKLWIVQNTIIELIVWIIKILRCIQWRKDTFYMRRYSSILLLWINMTITQRLWTNYTLVHILYLLTFSCLQQGTLHWYSCVIHEASSWTLSNWWTHQSIIVLYHIPTLSG